MSTGSQQTSRPPRLLLRVPFWDESDILLICPDYSMLFPSYERDVSLTDSSSTFVWSSLPEKGRQAKHLVLSDSGRQTLHADRGKRTYPLHPIPVTNQHIASPRARRLSLPLGYGVTRCRPWLSLMVRNGVSTKSRYGSKDERGRRELFLRYHLSQPIIVADDGR